MNKQEAIEKIYNASWDSPDYEGLVVKVETVNEIIYQIHEPQKVVVPKIAAEWIEEHKAQFSNLYTVYSWLGQQKNQVSEWVNSNIDIFARAWLDGYEIEQEKLYKVTVPGTSNYKNQRQHLVKQGKHWFFCGNDVNRFKYRFTKGQIEAAGFGWVFDCKGVKVEEVEEN
ncbi:DUF1642 domain-containing protein [Streptococcus suis]